jgi:uncharacterized membrane protein YgdD (TMEM256/DUF423 family)
MSNTTALRLAALCGATGVVLGAFGAHLLKPVLDRNQTAAIWQTAVFYHLIHALMLYVIASRAPLQVGPWLSFLAGILVFSGSLYLLAFTNARWLGAVTPIGGVGFMVGWVWLALVAPKLIRPT